MQIPKIDFRQIATSAKKYLGKTGENTCKLIKDTNGKFDKFVSSKNLKPKEVKQVGLGALVFVAGAGIVISCVKNIVQNLKKEIEEK